MSEKANLLALSGKVNLPLFGGITHFILESAKASREQIRELSHRCVLFDTEREPVPVQEKYNFLYLGELLERYEERFGMPLPDLRAIALALGYTNGLLTKEMFVGSQKKDFVEKIKKQADKDIYLTGALYLLGENAPSYEKILLGMEYTATEELIFAVSIFHPDFPSSFQHFKPQLLRLLGRGRTIPVIGNLLLFGWFIREADPLVKTLRTKDAALFRALCSLQKSFVRPGCHPHDVLLEEGYTTLEIAYANVLAVRSQIFDGEISGLSVVAEKIVVELFRNAIPREEPFPPEVYDQFTLLFRQFEKFHIKCYGAYSLMETLEEQVVISNHQTFMWLSSLAALSNPIFRCFDILEPKWDSLVALGPEKYEDLFRLSLHDSMTAEEIKLRIERYAALASTSYIETICKKGYGRSFRMLVEKGVIDMWELFSSNLDEAGQVRDSHTMECIGAYLEKDFSVWAFHFYEKFFAEYGIQEIERFFSSNRARIFSPLVEKKYGYGKTDLLLTLHRDFLSEEEHRKVLGWLQEYYFMEQPASYMMLVKAVLFDNLALKEYRKMAESVAENAPPLQDLISSLDLAPLNMFLEYWKAGGCLLHELQAMKRLLDTQPGQDWPALLRTHSAYTNTLYGRKFKSFDLSELGEDKDGLVIYAIAHNKKHFIRLVDGRPDMFLQLPSSSILFQKEFYDGHFNINELTEKTLEEFAGVTTCNFRPDRLEPGRRYSFQEIQALSGKGGAYWVFYHALASPSQDYRLLVFRQICKGELLSGLRDEDIPVLAAILDKKPLHNWRQEDFGHIQGLRPHEVVQMLLHMEELRYLIPTMHDRGDVSIVLRNLEAAGRAGSIEALKEGLLQSDKNWLALAERMELSSEFLAQHKEKIVRFLCRDGASVVQTYRGCLPEKRQEAFLRVVKAELMGKLHELKYFAGDLQRELDTPVTDKIKAGWKKCLSLSDKGITVDERDDFFSTMFAGEQPQRTCLSYINGAYRACLLSGFDSNKKLLYADIGGRTVGRAFLRLTKVSLSGKTDTNLTLVDLEAAASNQQEERVVLFLERPYISGIGPKEKEQAICLFQELARKKALELGVTLVLSWDYYSYVPEGFTQTRLNLYISKSKAGCQYLDSLEGQATVDTEGSYRAGRFLVSQAGNT